MSKDESIDCGIDSFYTKLNKEEKFPTILDLFYVAAVESISKAEAERSLSKSGTIIDKKSTRISNDTFNDRKHIIAGMSFYDNNVANVNIVQKSTEKYRSASSTQRTIN